MEYVEVSSRMDLHDLFRFPWTSRLDHLETLGIHLNPPTLQVRACRAFFKSSRLQMILSSFLSFFLPFFFSSEPPTPRGEVYLPFTLPWTPPLSPMEVCWECGDSVVFLLYLVGAGKKEGVRSFIKTN